MFHTVPEAAALLGLSIAMVRRHCQSGALEARKVGRDWLIETDAIEKFKADKRSPGRPPAPRE